MHLSLKGTKSVAGGNAPGKLKRRPTLKGSQRAQDFNHCDVFVETSTLSGSGLKPSFPGALPPAINFMPFRHVTVATLALTAETNNHAISHRQGRIPAPDYNRRGYGLQALFVLPRCMIV